MKRALISISGIAALLAVGQVLAAEGKEVYANTCAVCHDALPPKLGDKAEWALRIKNGIGTLVATVVKGKGAMPPKAGDGTLSDADIKAAIEYIISQAK